MKLCGEFRDLTAAIKHAAQLATAERSAKAG
jgi:hypothetical protein